MIVLVIKNPETYFANTQFYCTSENIKTEIYNDIQSGTFNPDAYQSIEKIQYDTDDYRQRRVGLYNEIQNYVYKGLPLRELFQWEGINLLQFISDHFFTSYTGLIDSLAHLAEVFKILQETKLFSDLHFIGHINESEQELLNKIKCLLTVPVSLTVLKEPVVQYNRKSNVSQQDIMNVLSSYPQPDEQLKGKVLLFTNPRNQRVDSSGRAFEVFYEGLSGFFNEIGEEPCRLIRDGFEHRLSDELSSEGVKGYIDQQMNTYSYLGFPLFSLHFATGNEFPDFKKYLNTYLELVKELVKLPDFIKLFDWGQLNLLVAVPNLWINLFTSGLVAVVPTLVRMQRLISFIQPKAVFCTVEYDWLARAVIVAAQQRNIPTFGLQHGKIFNSSDVYYYNNTSYDNTLKHTVPRYTMVWGDYFKQLLTTRNDYPNESVVNAGCDWRLFNVDEGFNEYKVWPDTEKKRLLFLPSLEYPVLLLNKIVELFPSSTWQILIKPHQADKEYDAAHNFFSAHGYSIMVEKSVLHECIKSSDLVLTALSSSVVQEVLFHKKRLITFKLNNLDHDEYSGMQTFLPDILALKSIDTTILDDKPWEFQEIRIMLDNAGYGNVNKDTFTQQMVTLWETIFPDDANERSVKTVSKDFNEQLNYMKSLVMDVPQGDMCVDQFNADTFSGELAQAIVLYNDRRFDESIDAVLSVLREKPDVWSGYFVLAQSFYQKGFPEKSIQILEGLIEECPEYYEAKDMLVSLRGLE